MKTVSKIVSGVLVFLMVISSCSTKRTEEQPATKTNDPYHALAFAINGTSIKGGSSDSVERASLNFTSLNLEGAQALWPDHANYFLHAMGLLNFPSEGEYKFRLSTNGKIVFRMNNHDVFHVSTPKDTTYEKTEFVSAGKNMFEFEYFDGGLDPKIVLEWAPDGQRFVTIPDSMVMAVEIKQPAASSSSNDVADEPLNTLTAEEKAAGWKLLFDGKTTKGWHRYNSPGTIGSKWKVEDGLLTFAGRDRFRYELEGRTIEMGETNKKEDGGLDIVTDQSFKNFELKLDWKISKGGNSGIFYTVKEDSQYDEAWKTSPEMQVLDDAGHKDGLIYKHRSGDLYDLIACSEVVVKPYGEWNRVRIVKDGNHVEHWLNGTKVVEFEINSEAWNKMIGESKFKNLKEYATAENCKIALQDHDNQVWFKNIKIREIK